MANEDSGGSKGEDVPIEGVRGVLGVEVIVCQCLEDPGERGVESIILAQRSKGLEIEVLHHLGQNCVRVSTKEAFFE